MRIEQHFIRNAAARSFINRVFLAFSMEAGLDCAICDPNNQDIKTTMLAAELLLGQDKHCLKFTRAFRAGVFNKYIPFKKAFVFLNNYLPKGSKKGEHYVERINRCRR